MNISIGIVGLPNVGKSTLYNTVTKNKADVANYPFCTIEPNKGVVKVHDPRLEVLAKVVNSNSIVPAIIEFVDIAGLVRGASKGEGLGNQFLANIREVAAIVHVVRDFQNDNIIHVEGRVNPLEDIETVETELILKDMELMEKKVNELKKKAKLDKVAAKILESISALYEHLGNGKMAYDFPASKDQESITFRKELFLLTDKPQIYLFNSAEGKINTDIKDTKINDLNLMVMDIKLESELMELDESEREQYVKELGIESTGIEALTKKCYEILGLISYFTAGEQEVRAWTIRDGAKAPEAAGTIHTDFEKNFIAAEVITYDHFVEVGGWVKGKEKGYVNLEGKEYVVKEGDVMLFKHN